MERITGPFLGHYVAAYAAFTEQGYIGYAKICSEPPTDVWLCDAIDKVGGGPRSTLLLALEAAERKAVLFVQALYDYYGLVESTVF